MKKDKWLKWKLGAGGAVALVVLFQTVKASPEFREEKEKVQDDKKVVATDQEQGNRMMDDWYSNSGSDNGEQSGETSDGANRMDRDSGGPSRGSQGGADTRTGGS